MSWRHVPLLALYRRVEESGRPELPLLSVYRDYGVVPREGRVDNFNKSSDDLSRYKVVRPGYLVLNKMKTWQGSLGVSSYEGIVSPAYFTGKRIAAVEDRFMHHLLRSRPLIAEYAARSKGIRPSQWDLSWEEFASIKVQLPSVTVQRAIADFLDAETARIDTLIAKKRELFEMLGERRAGRIELAVRELVATWGDAPLKYLVDEVSVGIVITPAAWYAESGVPALRGINVKPGQIQSEGMVQITEEGHALHRKSVLRSGDIVVVRTGQAGAAAVVPKSLAGANCIDLIIIRPGRRIAAPFLEFVLNSDWTQKHVDEHSVGTIQSHFNVAAMKQLPVPQAPVEQQLVVARRLASITRQIDDTAERLSRQMALLQEHRQALITAAVTGELDVSAVAA